MENAENLQEKVYFLEKENSKQSQRIQLLEELIRQLKHRQFGSSSEKQEAIQPSLFTELVDEETAEAASIESADSVTVAAHQRKSRPRVSIPANLPRVEVIHDIADDQKICPHDSTPLKLIGADTSEQLDYIPAQLRVLLHKRLKYACPCCESHIITAKKPPQPIEKCIASPALLAVIAIQKYMDALPLYRQSQIFKRLGIELDRSNMANWMMQCGDLIDPLIEQIRAYLLQQDVLHMDETVVQVLAEPGKTPQSDSRMWVMRGSQQHPAVWFHYTPTRKGKEASDMLGAYSKVLMVDGYEGYNAICKKNNITRLGCWAHARRKFTDAQIAQGKNKTGKADVAIAFIQNLYLIDEKHKEEPLDVRTKIRQQESMAVIDKLRAWLDKQRPHVLPKSAIGKAVIYLHNQWPRLLRCFERGDYPLDNNAAENAVRPFAVGRKNWLFSASQKGARASANLYSLIETAKANQLEPLAYLTRVLTELPAIKDDPVAIAALLPWNTKPVVG
jgi:transposase